MVSTPYASSTALPAPGNEAAATLHAKNRFSVTRQVHYNTRNPGLSLDLVLFINGLPLITFELKNNLTKQTVEDAVEQYRTSRDPRDDLFRPGRCAALCVEEYLQIDEDGQVEFKSSAKAFTRLYAFLSQVLPYGNPRWEKLSIFLNFLIPKLPAPVEPDLSRGVLEAVDMDSYRMERKAAMSISLAEEDAEIYPVLPGAGGGTHEPEMDRLSNIIAEFNKTWACRCNSVSRTRTWSRTTSRATSGSSSHVSPRRSGALMVAPSPSPLMEAPDG